MKRILIFSLNYFPRFNSGAEIAVKEITDRVSPDEYEFHLITLRFDSTLPKEEKIGNVFVHRIGFSTPRPSYEDLRKWPLHFNKYLFQFHAFVKAVSLHRQFHFDGIWVLMAHSAGVPAALFKLFHPQTSYLLTLQEGDPPEYIERTMRPLWPLFSRAFTSANHVQAISNFLGAWARRRGFAGPLSIIPNGVDTTGFKRTIPPEERETVREKWGIRKGDTVLITASRLVKKNACDDVIRALALLPENIHFVIAGEGPDLPLLRSLAEEHKVVERVHFLGFIGHDRLPLLLKSADIFIRPARSEGFGNSFIEAMAAEIPVIATPVGGIPDFLIDPKNTEGETPTGYLCEPDNPESIKEVVTYILAHNNEAQTVIKNALRMVCEKYQWERIASDMKQQVFRSLWGESGTH